MNVHVCVYVCVHFSSHRCLNCFWKEQHEPGHTGCLQGKAAEARCGKHSLYTPPPFEAGVSVGVLPQVFPGMHTLKGDRGSPPVYVTIERRPDPTWRRFKQSSQNPPLAPSPTTLTGLGHLRDGHPLLLRHEAQDREDGKPGHEAGAAVEEAEGDAVPVGQAGGQRKAGSARGCQQEVPQVGRHSPQPFMQARGGLPAGSR